MRKTFCIYQHIHPESGQLVYVGIGRYPDRAYDIRTRKFKHMLWCVRLLREGYEPADWVSIVQTDLTLREAERAEGHYIKKEQPKYNIQKR